ncbi:hypothetical protein ACP70R_047821 [Stipagrostis hirtigluma subsp. patula]
MAAKQIKEVKPSNTSEEMQRTSMEGTQSPTEDLVESHPMSTKYMLFPSIFRNSSHSDGAIYKKEELQWKHDYFDLIGDRNETGLEPMRFSVATRCKPDPETCRYHSPCTMVQFLSLKLAKAHINSGPVLLYGYLAARDDLDSALNYVFNRTRDDPIVVQQGLGTFSLDGHAYVTTVHLLHKGSPIEMTGPKRGILLYSDVLFEFDMRIKIGEKEDDDLQLIDGIIELYEVEMLDIPVTIPINGSSGNVDMLLVKISKGVEATVEVFISEVHNDFDFYISVVSFLLHMYLKNFSSFVAILLSRVA